MAQARRKKPNSAPLTLHISRGLREAGFLVLSAAAIYFLIALVSYSPNDPSWTYIGDRGEVQNLGGVVGAWFADVFFTLIGFLAYLIPVIVGYSGWLVFHGASGKDGVLELNELLIRWAGFFLTVIAGCGLATMYFSQAGAALPSGAGGILGRSLAKNMVPVLNVPGTTLTLLAGFVSGVPIFSNISWLSIMDKTGWLVLRMVSMLRGVFKNLSVYFAGRKARAQRETVSRVKQEKEKQTARKPVRIEPVIAKPELSDRLEKERQVPLFEAPKNTELPPLMLLDPARESTEGYSREALEAMSRLVELKLQDFGVEVEVVAVHPGPVITRFELQPGAGVKVSQISNLAKDIARALSAISVRVVEVIPGKSVIGLEIPNEQRELVALSEILQSRDYDAAGSPLTLALGKDISGQAVVVDLARMPHLLVAGTTGSGKSVAINAMILSLLYKSLPSDVRLIMIDPKMLELSVYEGIPHLLAPVVTDMKEAGSALRWCVGEMERRYQLMAALGVRNIGGYNRKVREAIDAGEPIPDPTWKKGTALDSEAEVPTLQPVPFIVVIVDELADLMMVVGKKVEELIARLAQKARASGIHLILATQRPSVDVITGLIKANIPTRIAFQVSSKVDSRTILDQGGAEQLLGHGDMLYLAPGTGLPNRVHGAFVSDEEVHKVVDHLKGKSGPEYIEEILQGDISAGQGGVGDGDDTESDPLYDEAVRIVTETRKASISGVQRRLKIGYNRAARMIEHMEQVGIVSTLQSNGSREVLAPPPVES